MELRDFISVVALIVALIAVFVTHNLTKGREKRDRTLNVFSAISKDMQRFFNAFFAYIHARQVEHALSLNPPAFPQPPTATNSYLELCYALATLNTDGFVVQLLLGKQGNGIAKKLFELGTYYSAACVDDLEYIDKEGGKYYDELTGRIDTILDDMQIVWRQINDPTGMAGDDIELMHWNKELSNGAQDRPATSI